MKNSTSTSFCSLLSWQLDQLHNCLNGMRDFQQGRKEANVTAVYTPIALTDSFSVQIFTTVRDVPEVWDKLVMENKLFLQRSYLTVLEQCPPQHMQFCYFLFFEEQQAVGIAIGQILPFQASESLNGQTLMQEASFLPAAEQLAKDFLAQRIRFSALTIGNLLLTGDYGFTFLGTINRQTQFTLLVKAATCAQQLLTQKGWKFDAVSFKDFFEETRPAAQALTQFNFKECCIQPNMVMPLKKEWKIFEDYLSALTSKYRVRARRAFKKAKSLRRQILDANAIGQHLPALYQLYKNVVQQADFNILTLHPRYFLALAQELGDAFQLTAYYKEDTLVGFFTTIKNGPELEAHFLGFEEAANLEHQLYLNMLYDIIEFGIQKQVERIVFARTAPEIKSSVGAKAQEMYCYIRHRQPVFNQLMRPLLSYLQPKVEWEERHPFKV